MNRIDLWAAIRQASTYVSDEGTGGWLLSENQIDAIMAAADSYRADGLKSLADEFDMLAASYEANPPQALTVGRALRQAANLTRSWVERGPDVPA